MPLSRVFGRYGVSCELVDVPIRSLSRYKRKRFYAVKFREIACRKRQPGAFAGAARTHSGRRAGRPQEGTCHGRVGPVCQFRGGGGGSAPVEVFGQRWAVCGRRLPGIVMARESQPSKVSNSRGRILPGSPVSGPLGAFDFSTRIKGGGRKRPPPGHKAPQCGAFPAFAEGAPFRHGRRF